MRITLGCLMAWMLLSCSKVEFALCYSIHLNDPPPQVASVDKKHIQMIKKKLRSYGRIQETNNNNNNNNNKCPSSTSTVTAQVACITSSSEQFSVAQNFQGLQSSPSLAYLNNNTFAVTWASSTPQGGFNLVVKTRVFHVVSTNVDQNGNLQPPQPLTADIQIPSSQSPEATNQRFPAIASLSNATFLIVYQANINGETVIAGHRFDSLGHRLGSEMVISNPSALSTSQGVKQDFYPAVNAITLQNNQVIGFVVSWIRYAPGSSSAYTLFARFYDKNATPFGEEVQVNTWTSLTGFDFSTTTLTSGSVLFVWQGSMGCVSSAAYAQSFTAQGGRVGTERLLLDYTALPFISSPTIQGLGGNEFVLVWVNTNGQNPFQSTLTAQKFDNQGALLGQPFLLSQEIGFYGSSNILPVIGSAGENQGFIVLWEFATSQGSGFQVVGQQFGSNGFPVEGKFLLNPSSNQSQTSPSGSLLDNHQVMAVVWTGEDQTSDQSFGIFGRLFTTC